MKALTLLTIVVIVLFNNTVAQTKAATDDSTKTILDKSPLVMINSQVSDLKYAIINPGNIEKMEVYKSPEHTKQYGEAGKYGVIVVTTQPQIELVRVNELLQLFNISEAHRSLRVCINKTLVKDTGKILADKNEVERIEITTERHWNYPEENFTGEQFINIITKNPAKAS